LYAKLYPKLSDLYSPYHFNKLIDIVDEYLREGVDFNQKHRYSKAIKYVKSALSDDIELSELLGSIESVYGDFYLD
jgi:hypothetical protein